MDNNIFTRRSTTQFDSLRFDEEFLFVILILICKMPIKLWVHQPIIIIIIIIVQWR